MFFYKEKSHCLNCLFSTHKPINYRYLFIQVKMHSALSRLNSVFAFTLSVAAAVTFACFLTTVLNNNVRKVDLNVNKAVVKNIEDFSAYRQKNDLGTISFDLRANLTDIFDWNCKQLFIYLVAEYETKANKLNQVVLWDKIIKRHENAMLDIKGVNTKYYFFDDGHGLKENEVTLSLRWNTIPNAGYMWQVTGEGEHAFKFPASYSNARRN